MNFNHLKIIRFVFISTLVAAAASEASLLASSDENTGRLYPLPDVKLHTIDSKRPLLDKKSMAGDIWLVNTVFTRCKDVCPVVSGKMKQWVKALSLHGNVQFLSVTTDPSHDSPKVLEKFAKLYIAGEKNWTFAQASPEDTKKFITEGLKLPYDPENPNIHSTRVALIDKQGWVMDYFDIMEIKELSKIRRYIKRLNAESDEAKKTAEKPSKENKL